jgi:hypothetical protein
MIVPVRAGADMRLLRAAVFSAVCVALSAAGHAIASGASVPPWALLAGWAMILVFAALLAGRERSLPGIAAALLGGQLGLHALFSAGQWCQSAAPAARSSQVVALARRLLCGGSPAHLSPDYAARVLRRAGIDPSAVHHLPATPAMPGMPGMPITRDMSGLSPTMHGAMGYSLPMICVHLAAAVIAGWVLRRGEAALWRLVRLSVQGATALSSAAAPHPLRTALAAARSLAAVAGLAARRLAAARRPGWSGRGHGMPECVALEHFVVRRGPPAVGLAV